MVVQISFLKRKIQKREREASLASRKKKSDRK